MRRTRNRTEYGVTQVERAEVDLAVRRATAIVTAVRSALG